MKRASALLIAASLVFSDAASAQLLTTGAGGAALAGYQGPGDVISGAIAFYSCRAYNAAAAGTKAYRIVRASDSTQTDINSLANGKCDTSTPATFCNATTCKVVTWYDQSGALACAGSVACDVTQATDANRPSLTLSALNGWPCATDSGPTGVVLETSVNLVQAQPFSFSGIGERTGAFTSAQRFWNSNASATNFGWRTTTNTVGTQSGTMTATASDSAYHVFSYVTNNGGTSTLVVDGAATTGTLGLAPLSAHLDFFNDASGSGDPMNGNLCEAGFWPIGFNATQYGNINTNMHSASNGWNF